MNARLLCASSAAVLLATCTTWADPDELFQATLELSTLTSDQGVVINGADPDDNSGYSISSAGDVNGDGIDDLVIGRNLLLFEDNTIPGGSYVVFGSVDLGNAGAIELGSLDGTNGFAIPGINDGDFCGRSISPAGDFNDDGFDDLIVGAYGSDVNGSNTGQSYMIYGGVNIGAGGLVDVASLNGANGFAINGIDTLDGSGFDVSTAGDLNNDGVDDVIIGAWTADPNGNSSGESYVIFGGSGVGASGAFELASLDGSNGFVINGINPEDRSGGLVASIGDVNDDGVSDVLISNLAVPSGQNLIGVSSVVFGGIGIGASGVLELSSLNGANGFTINGIDPVGLELASESSAGDINGDGVNDLIMASHRADPNGSDSGQSYVVFGGSGLGASGTLELASLDGSNGFVINGVAADDWSGSSVSAAGDLNSDGADDMIIGAWFADPNQNSNAGACYVVFGGPGVGATGTIELSALDGSNGFAINGVDSGDFLGGAVSYAGDVNLDGKDDVVIGAPGANPDGKNDSGISYVIYGRCLLPADINLDGVVDTADIGTLIAFFGDANPIVQESDINGDGVVDTADLGILISSFGEDCDQL